MIFEQSVVIPKNHTLRLNIPVEIPCGPAFLTLTAAAPDTMLLSETALAQDWNTPEEDAAWELL